jgi:hypothetical protein
MQPEIERPSNLTGQNIVQFPNTEVTPVTLPPPNLFSASHLDNLLDFETLKNTQRNQKPNKGKKPNRRTRRSMDFMDYLPIDYVKTVSDFPSNKILAKHGLEPNSAVVRTQLEGDDGLYIAELMRVVKPAVEGQVITVINEQGQQEQKICKAGEMIPSVDGVELMTKIMVRAIVSWTFKSRSTGQVFEITEETVRKLRRDDFDYLSVQFLPLMDSVKDSDEGGEPNVEPETAPAKVLTEAEKN